MNIKNPYPLKQGLYDPKNEHDSCGIGFVANIKGVKSKQIVDDGMAILSNLTHRGAVGADPDMGDGAGVLIQIPHDLFKEESKINDIKFPEISTYGVGMIFFPNNKKNISNHQTLIEKILKNNDLEVFWWRKVPVNSKILSVRMQKLSPLIYQAFIKPIDRNIDQNELERKLFLARKLLSRTKDKENKLLKSIEDFYICSMSSRTLLYKGMLLADTVDKYFIDLKNPLTKSAMALVHQRFSTNTFPSWALAQPFRMICHNGEINTLRGNINWMAARRHAMQSKLLGEKLDSIFPIIREGQSDSACLDNALELLVMAGYSLAHAMMILIPEAWQGNKLMDANKRSFYEYYSTLMEPWDGPAAVAFTDGRQIGATLDRNGLRPARYFLTDDDRLILASEMGVLRIPENKIIKKWRLQPGRMLLADFEKGRIVTDEEIKKDLIKEKDYKKAVEENTVSLSSIFKNKKNQNEEKKLYSKETTYLYQKAFGYTKEDIKFLMTPMVINSSEAVGSMGTDTPIAVLSEKNKLLFNYFKQNFAQVTNPAIDPIREDLVMSLNTRLGPRGNLFGFDESIPMQLFLENPILIDREIDFIHSLAKSKNSQLSSATLNSVFDSNKGFEGFESSLLQLLNDAESSVLSGHNILIISDKKVDKKYAPIPSSLSISAVHHHLVKKGLRTSVGLVSETGEAREVHHFCVLAGYGADAIHPYLALRTILETNFNDFNISNNVAIDQYIKAIGKGILKVMSKMGISTYQSYAGAQIFDAVGLSSDFIKKYFKGTPSTIEGVGDEEVIQETLIRHNFAFNKSYLKFDKLDEGGEYAFRINGEEHMWNPSTISNLQHAVRLNNREKYNTFSKQVNEQSEKLLTPRGLFKIQYKNNSIPLSKVEPATEIVKRFATGAMSFGSISREAHTTLAIAMNRIGGKSNTGEGGEETDRFKKLENGDSMNSSIKQVASGRFGVTTEYLVHSKDIQIKIAQGAKPGEGGQLPGHKVDKIIAKVRHSTPGVGLISPPPHHDIYSIEDLAQLIFDLKNVNPKARISVKLVSEVGVGTVAAGVSKARADHVTIAGFDGGTGASPLTSIKHAGSPWEIGLAETQQTLVLNRLRGRIAVQVDGGLRTGRDVVIGALLGADEFGFATAPLIAAGCIMMRKCHLNTCPVGIATQNPVLRKKFKGLPEHVINYFFFVAEEVRDYMAKMGFKKFNDMVGKVELLETRSAVKYWKANGLDFSRLFNKPKVDKDVSFYNSEKQFHPIDNIMDRELIKACESSLRGKKPVVLELEIKNTDRTVGAMLSGALASMHGHKGLLPDTIVVRMRGTAGQSYGAFLSSGITFELSGEANDYVGKGLSGGRIVIYPPAESSINPEESIIIGNTVLYGAISGECFFRGIAGERFAVRNSGAIAVVEGLGDHGCEYMTGGIVVCLGEVGRNFAAGMSGGIAYVLDESDFFKDKCNLSMVEIGRLEKEENLVKDEEMDIKRINKNMLTEDESRLFCLIQLHARYTNSSKAKNILQNWDKYFNKFIKVMPLDYKKALINLNKERINKIADESVIN